MTDIICTSPVNGHVLDSRSFATPAEIDAAVAAARTAQKTWARMPLPDRIAAALRFLDALKAMNEDIVPELALQMGRPIRYGGEIRGVEERVRHMAGIAEEALAPISPAPRDGFIRTIKREPLGLVFVIAPWNYPYLTTVNSVVPALIAGNAVILKHSEQTILVGDRFQMAMDRAGLPEGLFQHVAMSHEGAAKLMGSGLVDHVSFTGSVRGGREMERALAGTFASLGLELGGKDPAYVRADANLAHAIENLVDGAYFNSGQSCCGIERIYVDSSVYNDFVAGFETLARGYVLGDPLETETTLGPMAQARLAATVREHIAEAVAKGAHAHVDAKAFDADEPGTPYLAPQMLTNVDHSMRVMREETFGPVVGIVKVASEAEAIRLMNDSEFGLTASIWTSDAEAAERIGAEIETGTVFMNRCDYVDPGLPWTGVKHTGRGAALSVLGYQTLTQPKGYHLRTKL
ncbi:MULTISPECIES: aldehyde dehydrogenase family protein [Rhodomicrobium]|uniref:aldehyde dehydrogenase family protein n=1 Tax=Rhodomicrobium TaxID=1068 RepID=UPI000B4A84CD|nr:MULTISPECIES: aldehyde dehydrogenase family protein [Rhodomicrobium]